MSARLTLIAAALALLAGCAAPPPLPPRAPAAVIADARERFEICLAFEEPEFDDGVSDAATVARGLGAHCPREWLKVMTLTAQGYNSAVQAAIYRDGPDLHNQIALQVVLRARARRMKQ